MTRELHINLNLNTTGYHRAAWRAEGAHRFGFIELPMYLEAARIAARGKLDAIFLADTTAHPINDGSVDHLALDPFIIASAIFSNISDIGVIVTTSALYSQPYQLARALSSLDHISGGRVGWNVVTGLATWAYGNFGLTARPDTAERWELANELLEVVLGLLTSWDRDALVGDLKSGQFIDNSKIRPINHKGKHFSVTGPLQLPQGPQERPFLVVAGPTEGGRTFAAGHADALFTVIHTESAATALRADIYSRLKTNGRSADHVSILPGLNITLGSTEKEAWDRLYALEELITPEARIGVVARVLDIPSDTLELDRPIPLDLIEGRQDVIAKLPLGLIDRLRAGPLTVREFNARGHEAQQRTVGTPEQVAGLLGDWFENGHADGFNISTDVYPGGLETFVDHVIPILQKRGIFRTEYRKETLRERYGHRAAPRP